MNIFVRINNDGTMSFPFTVLNLREMYPSRTIPLTLLDPSSMDENVATVYLPDGRYLTVMEEGVANITTELPVLKKGKWIFDPSTLIEEPILPVDPVGPAEKPEATLDELKNLKLRELSIYTDSLVNDIGASQNIPMIEIQTWPVQMAEAQAWEYDNSAKTPILDTIAKTRGVGRSDLIHKTLVKSKAYNNMLAFVVGSRQALEDKILSVKTKEELSTVRITIEVPPHHQV